MTAYASHLAAEIATQPDDWAAVLSRTDEARAVLPQPGESVAVVGCGTSFFMAQAYAVLRETAGSGVGGRTEAHAASEFPAGRTYDHVVAISRSGTTTEVIELLTALRERGQRTTAIVATEGTAIPDLATHALLLPEVDEQSVVQTRFATTALILLRATLGEDVSAAIADARAVLAEDEASALAGVAEAEQITFVGRGWTDRPGQRGGAEAARVGPVLDRVLPRDGVPPRPDQHRHHRAGDLGLRRGARGTGRGRARHGSPLRAPRHRPPGRPGAPAPPVPGQGGTRGSRP